MGFLLGYVAFALIELWLYGGFWPTIFVGFPLHAPVTAFYTALLMLLRRRWPEFVTRAALLGCGVGMGFFPALGAFPVYFFRVDAMLLIFCIHIAVLGIIILVAYWIGRLSKRSLKT